MIVVNLLYQKFLNEEGMVTMLRKWLRDNNGYTLVELIVTIGVMAIVGGAIAAFVVTAQRNYNYGSAETDLQYEAQLVVNQLQDLVMDSIGLTYSFDGTLADGSAASNSNIFADTDSEILGAQVVDTKSLYVYAKTEYYVLEWNQAEKKIYFSSYDTAGNPIETDQLLAEFVTGFSVDLRDISDNNTVKFTLTLEKEGTERKYTTSHKIKLRNEVLVNKELSDIYSAVENIPIVSRILVNPPYLRLWPGEAANVSASVISSNGGIPSQNVIWKITGLAESVDRPNGKDMSEMSTVIVDQSAGNGVLTLDVTEGQADPDKKFAIKAEKVLADGSTVVSENEIEGYIRHITGVSAQDTAGRTSVESNADNNKLSEGEIVELTATIGGENLEDLTTSEMGGLDIIITATVGGVEKDYSDFITDVQIDENNGKVSFKVKGNIGEGSPELNIQFRVKKSGYTQCYCDMKYSLTSHFDVVIVDDNWKRQGILPITVENIDPDWIIEGEDGKKYLANDAINVTFRFYDSQTGLECKTATMSNNVNSGNSHVQENANVKLSMDYQGDYLNLNATLLSTSDFAYSYPYYTKWGYESWSSGADKVDITISLNGCSVTRTLNVEPVSFGYGNFKTEIAEAGSGWTWKDTVRIYATDEVSVAKAYYSMLSGWAADNEQYDTEESRYVGIIGDSGNNKKYDFRSIEDGYARTGEHYVAFTLLNEGEQAFDKMVGKTVTVKYEYNPYFGENAPAGYEGRFASVTGCDGAIEIVFVNRNVDVIDGKTAPAVSYCPPPGELQVDSKHYISEEQRYVVEKYDGDNTIINLQILKSGSWVEAWPGYELQWNAAEQKWIMQRKEENVVIKDDRSEPSVLYCPSETEMMDTTVFRKDNTYVYYDISATEAYAMSLDKQELHYQKLVNGQWITNVWGDAVMTWDDASKAWVHPESNMNLGDDMTKPGIPYCPAPSQLGNQDCNYEINYATSSYCDEYFAYNAKQKTITYIKNLDKVWGKTKLIWDDDSNCWIPFVMKQNVDIFDGRAKAENYDYCPEPDSSEWVENNRYYLNEDKTEWYALNDDKTNIEYRKASGNSSNKHGIKVWGDANLFWDSQDSVWTHYEANVETGNWGEITIPYCPSPITLMNDNTLNRQKYITYSISGEKNLYYRYDVNNGTLSYYENGRPLGGVRYWSYDEHKWVTASQNYANNVEVPWWCEKPKKEYCPEPSEFSFDSGDAYYYISDSQRFYVQQKENASGYYYVITLQNYTSGRNGKWQNAWNSTELTWNSTDAKWEY